MSSLKSAPPRRRREPARPDDRPRQRPEPGSDQESRKYRPRADRHRGHEEERRSEGVAGREIRQTSLAQAIATAEGKGEEKGGRAIDADFEKADSKNPAHYAIKVVYPSGKLVEYGINADTGELYKTENQPIERYFTRLKPADFQNAKVSLKDAIALAEQKAPGGKAYEAEVEREGNAVEYEIKVALTDREQEIKIGPDGVVK